MTTVGIFEAKNRLSELVERAAGGVRSSSPGVANKSLD